MNIASLVVGILAVLFALVPVYGPLIATPLIITGIILSLVVRRKNKRDGKDGRLAWAALLLSAGAIPVMILNTVLRW